MARLTNAAAEQNLNFWVALIATNFLPFSDAIAR